MSDLPASAASLQSDLSAQFRGPLIAFFARRIKDRREAEDLAQEVLLRVLSTDRRRIEHAANFVFKVAERTRNICLLFRLGKMKHKDIAERHGISISSVEKHVMRASLRLASRYGQQPEVTQR